MIELNKRNRIILIVGVTCIISALVFKAVRGSCSDIYSDFFIEGFDGFVLEKKRIPEQHNAQVVFIENRSGPIYLLGLEHTDFYIRVQPGDRFLKNANSSKCMLIKENDTLHYAMLESYCEYLIKNEK